MIHTHELSYDGGVVRKRFVSWSRDEPDREWEGLSLLHREAPGLAPEPLARERDGDAPVVVMSRLPGEPLGDARLSGKEAAGLVTAMQRSFAVPVDTLLRERISGPSAMRADLRAWVSDDHDLSSCPPVVEEALAVVRRWLDSDAATDLDRIAEPVAGRADGNLANGVWDGTSCRLVDFEDFGLSDLTYEIADVTEHATSRLRRFLDVEAFVAGFGLTRAQRDRLTEHRRLLAAFWLLMLLPGNPGFARNPRGSTEDQARYVRDLFD